MDFIYFNVRTGWSMCEAFESWVSNMDNIEVVSHDITVDRDGDDVITVIYKEGS